MNENEIIDALYPNQRAFEAYVQANHALQNANSRVVATVVLFLRGELSHAELVLASAKQVEAERARDMAERLYRHGPPEVS